LGGLGEDNFIGRLCAALSQNSSDFAILPPHFTQEGLTLLRELKISSFF
jgi:hypothetical protein